MRVVTVYADDDPEDAVAGAIGSCRRPTTVANARAPARWRSAAEVEPTSLAVGERRRCGVWQLVWRSQCGGARASGGEQGGARVGGPATAVERYGKLDVLLNNAGIAGGAPIDEHSREDWDTILAVNLTGAFNGIQAAVPAMKNTGRGSIVAHLVDRGANRTARPERHPLREAERMLGEGKQIPDAAKELGI